MSKYSKFAFPALLAGILSLTSCDRSATSGASFETRVDSCAYMTPDFYGDTLYSVASYSMMWPTNIGNNDLSALHDSLLMCAFDTITSEFNQAAEHFFRTGPVCGEKIDLQPTDMTTARKADKCNELISQSYVSLLTPSLLVIGIDNYGYFYGAAHGYGTSCYINYSISDQCVLNASNMFKPDKIQDVIETIKTMAGTMYPSGEVNADEITAINTFRITPTQVVFVFQPYDVAPYSMGVVEIPVNNYDLYETLTPLGHKVLDL